MPILTLYCTERGSTADVARHISAHIAEQLPPTEVHDMHDFDVSTLSHYTAIIIGSPVHGARWLSDAISFIVANKEVLTSKPLFAFSVGATDALPRLIRHRWQKWEESLIHKDLQRILDGMVWMHVLLGGTLDKENIACCTRLMCGLIGGVTGGDFRDWGAIDAWADRIVVALKRKKGPERNFYVCT